MLKHIFVVILVGAIFFVAVQFASMFFYAWEFEDFVKDEVKYAPVRESDSQEHFVQHITQQAHFYGLDIEREAIRVEKHTDAESGITMLSLEADYTMPVDQCIDVPFEVLFIGQIDQPSEN